MQYDPERMFHELETAAEAMATAIEEEKLLEELRKPVLNDIKSWYLKNGAKSVAEAEALAYSDDRYRDHIRGLAVAVGKSARAKARYHNLRALSEARRTQESSARALAR